jgi:uncharacterized membrane protein
MEVRSMSASVVYIAIGLIVLLALAAVVLLQGRRPGGRATLTPLAALSLGMVVAGIVFGEARAVGYTFFAIGIGLAIVDMVRKRRPRGPRDGGGAGDGGPRGAGE